MLAGDRGAASASMTTPSSMGHLIVTGHEGCRRWICEVVKLNCVNRSIPLGILSQRLLPFQKL